MATNPLQLNGTAGLYSRVLKIKPSAFETSPDESRGQSGISPEGKRRRILEEARSAVLARIRRPR